ncbi:hypothetical protein OAS67_07815 [Alphaproteobacteria bacterium]|nr:hypothetical protein [Alphaproteobacteria bacterium]
MAKAEHKEGYCMGAGVFAKRGEMSGKSKGVDPDGIYEHHYSNKIAVFCWMPVREFWRPW